MLDYLTMLVYKADILLLPSLSSTREGEEGVDRKASKIINKEFKIKDYGREKL